MSKTVHPYVQEIVASAGGILYKHLIGRLTSYPIPELPLPNGHGNFLDVGCNWGRWSIAARRKGYTVIGIDQSFEAVSAAKKVAQQLGIEADFVCADATHLPFRDQSFAQAFSFSVLQHMSKTHAKKAVAELKRVAANSLVEIPGKYGIRSLYHQLRRILREGLSHNREGVLFDIRYWSPRELTALGKIRPHAFFGTGALSCDIKYLPWYYKPIPKVSDLLVKIPFLKRVADSYWVSF